jgi:hypothetical protein
MNRRIPNGTYGGVRGRGLVTPSYSISPNRFPLAKERFERIINLALFFDHTIQKLLLLNVLEGRHQRARAVVLTRKCWRESAALRSA